MWWSHWILALVLLCTTCSPRDPDHGEGQIVLTAPVRASFNEYMSHNAPLYFLVTESGAGSYYIYCDGGFKCVRSGARMQALAECRRLNPGDECKIYAIGRSVVWRNADPPRPEPQLSASERLIKECLEGDTPDARIHKCSQALTSPELTQSQKRGPFYVRARAYEQIGRTSEAEQDYRAVLIIDPDHPAAKARLEALRGPPTSPNPTRRSSA
jgi:hypothetical protein